MNEEPADTLNMALGQMEWECCVRIIEDTQFRCTHSESLRKRILEAVKSNQVVVVTKLYEKQRTELSEAVCWRSSGWQRVAQAKQR